MEIPKEDRIDFIRIKDFISLCILNWKWFVVSILLITSMGVVYVLRSPSVFSRTMTIQIQSDMQGKSLPSNFESFEDLGIIQPKSNVLDEILVLLLVISQGIASQHYIPVLHLKTAKDAAVGQDFRRVAARHRDPLVHLLSLGRHAKRFSCPFSHHATPFSERESRCFPLCPSIEFLSS